MGFLSSEAQFSMPTSLMMAPLTKGYCLRKEILRDTLTPVLARWSVVLADESCTDELDGSSFHTDPLWIVD